MAIKIIQERAIKPIFKGECNRCGSLFEFEHSDANEEYYDQREGFLYNVTCPCCNKKVWVYKQVLRYEDTARTT